MSPGSYDEEFARCATVRMGLRHFEILQV